MSTRIANMQCELSLPLLVKRNYSNVTRLTVKCLYFPYLSPHYSQLIRTSLGPARPVPPILPAGRALIRSISSVLCHLDLDLPAADVPPGLPPWLLPTPKVSLTPTAKSDLPPLQLQLALEHVATVTASITAPHQLYTDGSLQSDGAAGCAVFSPDLGPPPGGWVGRRLYDHSSSTLCELYAILDAVSLVCQSEVNDVIICDSKPAHQSLFAVHPTHAQVVQQILSFLSLMNVRKLHVKFCGCHLTWVYLIMPQLTAWRRKLAAYLHVVMDALSPCPAISPGSAPPPSFPHGVAEMQRGLTASLLPTTSRFVAISTPIVEGVSWCGDIMLSLHACDWATVHRGRSPGWRGSRYIPNVVCAAHHCLTQSSTTAWPVPLSVLCYPKDSRWMRSTATSWTTIPSIKYLCAFLVLVVFPSGV